MPSIIPGVFNKSKESPINPTLIQFIGNIKLGAIPSRSGVKIPL